MIILIALVPAKFALNSQKTSEHLLYIIIVIENTIKSADSTQLSFEKKLNCKLILNKTNNIKSILNNVSSFDSLKGNASFEIRKDISSITKETSKLLATNIDDPGRPFNKIEITTLKESSSYLKGYIEYAPWWVLLMVSLSLGLGTMIGWKRIVVTVGEKIGKTPLNYAQGASAEIVTASTIALSTGLGLPVSTTHVLSSGVAGSMVAQEGLKNLRKKTIKNILTAWVITLPVTIVMAGLIFLLLRWLIG
jgi:PiT family inorganic phosphate transporter